MKKCPICNDNWGWYNGQLITKENCPLCRSNKNNNNFIDIFIIIMIIVCLSPLLLVLLFK